MNKAQRKEAIQMQAHVIINLMAVGALVAYLAVVMVPLFATIWGGVRLLALRKGRKAEEVLVFQEGLGFTMADGGERKKEE